MKNMLDDNRLVKLKSSLTDVMEQWMNDMAENELELWESLGTHASDFTAELMADAAFLILLTQKDMTSFYEDQGMLIK